MSTGVGITLFQKCIAERALDDAWAKVLANDGCAGVDGLSLQDFQANASDNLATLRQELTSGTYRPQALLGVDIPKENGRLRHLAIPTVRDRVIQTAVAQLLAPILDPGFDEASFAYRRGRSVQMATARIVDCRNHGLRWVVDADIRDFFDTIHHPTLLTSLRHQLPDDSLIGLLAKWMVAQILSGTHHIPRRSGLPQGSPISPILANLYLHPLDATLSGTGHTLVRYADDFLVLCSTRNEAEIALEQVRARLAALRLALNEEKTRITHFEAGFCFLGVHFKGERIHPDDSNSVQWLEPPPLNNADTRLAQRAESMVANVAKVEPSPTANMQIEGEEPDLANPDAVHLDAADSLNLPRSLHVITQGVRVTKDWERLVVSRGQEVIARVPLRLLDQIVVHGNALVSTAIIRHCQEHDLGLAFIDNSGDRSAILDTTTDASISLLKAQVIRDGDADFRIAFARACIEGKLHNCRAVLRRYARRESPDKVCRAISILGRSLRRLPRVADLDVLRGVEGQAARIYFAALSALMPSDWKFSTRNRQPPRDPVNSLLSYGYAVLFHVVRMAVVLARLHPGFGHLHAQVSGRPALVCDLMEEFRPLVVDAVVLALTRGRSLRPDQDFKVASDGTCRIEPAAKQAFIARLEAKLATQARHESGHATLHRLISAQGLRYASALKGGSPYRPCRA